MPSSTSGTASASRRRGGRVPASTSPRPRHAPLHVTDEDGRPYVVQDASNETPSSLPWSPDSKFAFKMLLTARLSSALWAIVSDCDETFNYWEPTHFLLYGEGFQTWEYSPQYALRSYLYLLVHVPPALIYDRIIRPNRMYIFFFLRCLLGLASTAAEVYLVSAVKRQLGPNVARITLAFLLCSAGMFAASTAFLPSSASMYLTMLSVGAWFRREYKLAILFTAMSTFLSWPFAALIGLPIAIDVLLVRKKLLLFIRWSLISVVAILLPQVAIDSMYYGKLVVAPLNIVKYNIFTDHGPDLYGVEPWTFYFLNGFLNFNVAFILALLAWPLQLLVRWLVPGPRSSSDEDGHYIAKPLHLLALYLWFAVFFTRPHKEERFLFPVYPLVALAAATSVDALQKLFFRLFVPRQNKHYLHHANWLSVSTILVFTALALSRIFSLCVNYNAPLNVWMHVSHLPTVHESEYPGDAHYNVCIGKEWHRFPSSFFLPGDNWHLKFVRSEFRGQLPQPYPRGVEKPTAELRTNFNDLNADEADRYDIGDVTRDCDFLVDFEGLSESALEPKYSRDASTWAKEASYPFLDAQHSHKLFRAFYLPFVSARYCHFGEYVLLRNVAKLKKHSKSEKQQRKQRSS